MPLMHALAIAAIAAVLGFFGGCAKGKYAGESDRMALAAQVQIANGSIDACAESLLSMQGHAEAELARAERNEQATAEALETVVRENLALSDQLADVERRQARARLEPTCREQMEVELCPSVPLL